MLGKLKRILPLLLAWLLCFGTAATTLSVTALGPGNVNLWQGSSPYATVPLEAGQAYGYRARVQTAFTAFSIQIATNQTTDSTATVGIYRWNTDYATTVSAGSLHEKSFVLEDNQFHEVSFAALPAGEYLFLVSNPVGRVSVYTELNSAELSRGYVYLDGREGRGADPKVQVKLAEATDEPFGVCAPSETIPNRQGPASGASGLVTVNFADSMGVLVHPTLPFSGVEFKLATYLSDRTDMRVSVYEWQGDYDQTVHASPLVTERIRLRDNYDQGISFDPLPAGEYLILAHEVSGTVGMYAEQSVTEYAGVVFRGGYPVDSVLALYPRCRLLFEDHLSEEGYFAPCETPADTVTGDHTPPPEATIPSDSLIHTHEVMPDTWVFTDGLGRTSLTHADVGSPRADKTLAMFYWTWHTDYRAEKAPVNVQTISEQYPEAVNDYDHPVWTAQDGAYFWNEPIWGYYRSDDAWVLRRQAELLANAGVDVVFTDNTNGSSTWQNGYTALMDTWSAAMEAGVRTPKVSFMLPFHENDNGSRLQLHALYRDIFRTDRWQSLWYYRDEKPMLLAHTARLSAEQSALEREILSFFTFRENDPNYTSLSSGGGQWGWLSTSPQTLYNGGEQMAVGVALNYDALNRKVTAMNGTNVMGRSYTSSGYRTEADAKLWGYQFAEQFGNALENDPDVLFLTGWNEWTAGRYESWNGVENAFPDQFNDEFSRDLEPSKGALKDHYYYQLVNLARQYKGVRPIPTPSGCATIDLDGGETQWQSIEPYYAAYIGNTDDRNARGYGDLVYTETSGRNDIIGAQVARDAAYVYFHVECAESITPYTDALWMNLYIDSDQENQGWNTFEFVLNKSAASARTLVLERFAATDDYASTEKVADVEYRVSGRYMTVKIPKSALGLTGEDYTINFAWTDNVHDEGNDAVFSGDILDFYLSGDVAPGGRFKYSFVSTAANAAAPTEVKRDITYRAVQVSTDIQTADTFGIRFAATVDSLQFDSVGFEISEARFARKWTSQTKEVYTALNAVTSVDGVETVTAVTAESFGGRYLVAATLKGIPTGIPLIFTVRPYAVGMDGTRSYGETYRIAVSADGTVTHLPLTATGGLLDGEEGFGSEYDWDS